MNNKIFRIIDANFNRSREGLRVCEDISRFILNSPSITRQLKSVRHEISEIIKKSRLSSRLMLDARDSVYDIGRLSRIESEARRRGAGDIFMANMERAKESVRVLEEFFKLIDIKKAFKFSDIRFRLYNIEKKALKRVI